MELCTWYITNFGSYEVRHTKATIDLQLWWIMEKTLNNLIIKFGIFWSWKSTPIVATSKPRGKGQCLRDCFTPATFGVLLMPNKEDPSHDWAFLYWFGMIWNILRILFEDIIPQKSPHWVGKETIFLNLDDEVLGSTNIYTSNDANERVVP